MSSDRKKTDSSQSAEQKRQESEEQLSLLQTITSELSTVDDLSSALKIVLRQICEKTGWALGQAWVPNKDGSVLVCDSHWFCGEDDLQEFQVASEAIHFKPGVGLPGRVWESKQPAWIEDVRQDPNFPRTTAAKSIGLKTAVGIPILSGDKLIAVIEFFMRESRAENEQLLRVIVAVAAHLDLVIERKRAAEELSRTNEILHSILSDMGDAVIVADKDENFLVFNPAAERMFGAGAIKANASEWPHHYGLYLPDKVTPFPHEQLPLIRSIHGEEVNNVEMFVRHEKAPHGIWTRITGRPLRDSNGELLGGVIVCRDITQIKEEEFFRAGQSRVLEMIAADAPLADVLTSLVLVSSDVLNRESVVTTELDPHLPQVQAALVQIQQVLLNLIINALDAVEQLPPAERRIIIKTRADKGDVAEVSVRDFGVGLPKDQPDKVFEHFFSTKQKGMGMGLTIVRSIIEAHGGTITAENAPDHGARMVVRLPAAPGQVQKSKAAA